MSNAERDHAVATEAERTVLQSLFYGSTPLVIHKKTQLYTGAGGYRRPTELQGGSTEFAPGIEARALRARKGSRPAAAWGTVAHTPTPHHMCVPQPHTERHGRSGDALTGGSPPL